MTFWTRFFEVDSSPLTKKVDKLSKKSFVACELQKWYSKILYSTKVWVTVKKCYLDTWTRRPVARKDSRYLCKRAYVKALLWIKLLKSFQALKIPVSIMELCEFQVHLLNPEAKHIVHCNLKTCQTTDMIYVTENRCSWPLTISISITSHTHTRDQFKTIHAQLSRCW